MREPTVKSRREHRVTLRLTRFRLQSLRLGGPSVVTVVPDSSDFQLWAKTGRQAFGRPRSRRLIRKDSRDNTLGAVLGTTLRVHLSS